MNQPTVPIASSPHSSAGAEFLHLVALNSFAIVQPILGQLEENIAFLRHANYSRIAILSSLALLMTFIPCVGSFVVYLLRRRQYLQASKAVQLVLIWFLTALILTFMARWASAAFDLATHGLPDVLISSVALALSVCLTRVYLRSPAYRLLLLLSVSGAILFPLSFFRSSNVRETTLGIHSIRHAGDTTIRNPVPIVMIVFDGLSGMYLLNEDQEIDAVRYPSFARLAATSHYFRNASTVHTRTDHALPAMLSSCFPNETQAPVENDYPLNLFRLIYDSGQYEMVVFEPYTQLAPDNLRRVLNHVPVLQQTAELTNILVRVLQRLCAPRDLEFLHLTVPRDWFRMAPPTEGLSETLTGKIVYGWDTQRSTQIEHFLKCVRPFDKPGFYFLHVAIPHDPLDFTPSGKLYSDESRYGKPILGSIDELWLGDEWSVLQAWQRYLFQVQYADKSLGRILDRLEEQGQLKDALLVVAADHGMSFRANSHRRNPDAAGVPDVIPVPLFIKLPGQTTGSMTDRNVETVDILPAIAQVLAVTADSEWEGISALNENARKPRKTVMATLNTVLDADFPQRFVATERMLSIFGSGTLNDRLGTLQTLPELVRKRTELLLAPSASGLKCQLFNGEKQFNPAQSDFVPCYLHGKIIGDTPPATLIAVSVNGVILSTSRTTTDEYYQNHWTAMLPESAFHTAEDRVQIFEVNQTQKGYELREIEVVPLTL